MHILVVDDEKDVQPLFEQKFRKGIRDRKIALAFATSGSEALDYLHRHAGDTALVLSDINMPGMSGLDVAREVLALRPDMPILITTGYVRADDVAAARKLGVRDVVLKPDTIEGLAAPVEAHLARASVE